MRGSEGDYSLIKNEPSRPLRTTDADSQRAERLRLEREQNKSGDFYDQQKLELKALKDNPDIDENKTYRNPDGDEIDADYLQQQRVVERADALTRAQLEAIEKAGEGINLVVAERARSIDGAKSDTNFSVQIKKITNAIQEKMSLTVRGFKNEINQNPAERVQIKALLDQAKSLGEGLDADLAGGKKNILGRRDKNDIYDIREKLEDLRQVERELNDIVRSIKRKNDEALRKFTDDNGNNGNSEGGVLSRQEESFFNKVKENYNRYGDQG